MTQPAHYPRTVFWSEEDKCFIALARDLPGCSAAGESELEALEELKSAISAWIEAAKSAGNPIPQPSDPSSEPAYSGRLVVRMPTELHAHLANLAEHNRVSLNQFIVYKLASSCGERPDADPGLNPVKLSTASKGFQASKLHQQWRHYKVVVDERHSGLGVSLFDPKQSFGTFVVVASTEPSRRERHG